jgi:hypothetical protein
VPVEVPFGSLDNAPFAAIAESATGHRYQRAYARTLGRRGITEQIDKLYRPRPRPLFTALQHIRRIMRAVVR